MSLTDSQIKRYARNISLPEIGKAGQEALLESSVLVIGAGGLGVPVMTYLAASGVGRIGIIDGDVVELSNLQRQVIYNESELSRSKVSAAAKFLQSLNPEIKIEVYNTKLDINNAREIIAKYDIISEGSDNFPTRFLTNEICFELKKTLVSAAVIGFSGQVSTFKPHFDDKLPCYRCFCPTDPGESGLPRCVNGGVLGSITGTLGTLQATEIIKELLHVGDSLAGYLLIYDGLKGGFRKVKLKKNKGCVVCG